MKNKFTYLITVLFIAAIGISCNDNDDNKEKTNFTGTWEYGSKGDIHFEFEYAEENISLPQSIVNLIPKDNLPDFVKKMDLTSIPVSLASPFFKKYAKGQMQKYFRGITFLPNQEMEVLMTMKGEPVSVKTTYEIQKNVLKMNIQSDDFKTLTGGKIPAMIQSVDLNYVFNDDKLTLYLDTKYVKVLLNAAPIMMKNADMDETLKKEISDFISEFSKNIKTLEIGAILLATSEEN